MAGLTRNSGLDAAVRAVAARIADRAAASIERLVEERVAREVAAQLARRRRESRPGPARAAAPARTRATRTLATRRPARQEITRWVADRRARRVPLFVIDQTGLDTKKAIVARFGEGAAFTKGKAPPAVAAPARPAEGASSRTPHEPKARPPIVRKAGAAR